jgi:hypothetical protein
MKPVWLPSTREAEVGGWQVRDQHGPHSKTLSRKKLKINKIKAWHWWLMPIILASWDAEIGGITIQGQPG